MHRSDTLEGEVVVHHGEHTFLHLATIPGVEDNLLAAGDVEGHAGLAVEAEFLIVVNLSLGSGIDGEVGGEVLEFLFGGNDEHVLYEVSLPSHFHDEADSHAGVFVGTAESIDYKKFLAGEFLLGEIFNDSPGALGHGVVVVLVLGGGPPDGVLGVLVHDNVFVFGRAAGVDTGHDVHSVELGELAFIEAGEGGVGLEFEEIFVRRVVVDGLDIHDTH